MRLAVFSVVNFLAALSLGTFGYVQGYGAGTIALAVVGVLVVLQLGYVIWIVISASQGDRKSTNERRANDPVRRSCPSALSGASNGTASRTP